MKYKIGLLILLLGLLIVVPHSKAETSIEIKRANAPIILDGVSYTKGAIIRDFVEIAFSGDLGISELSEFFWPFHAIVNAPLSTIYSLGKMKNQPWWAEYISRKKGFPKSDVINRWNGKIVVSTGWPKFASGTPIRDLYYTYEENTPGEVTPEYRYDGQAPDPELAEVVEQVVSSIAPIVKKNTGIEIVFQPWDSAFENTNTYARLRVLDGKFVFKNYFKTAPMQMTVSQGPLAVEYQEGRFLGALSFTPKIRAQVDGYIVPTEKNIIDMSVCKINLAVGKALMGDLFVECVLRSLGLPNLSSSSEGSVLSNWNKKFDSISLLSSLDGEKVTYNRDKRDDEWYADQALFKHEKSRFFNNDQIHLSQYDQLMMRLLYCDVIKAGMDRYAVINALALNDKCFMD